MTSLARIGQDPGPSPEDRRSILAGDLRAASNALSAALRQAELLGEDELTERLRMSYSAAQDAADSLGVTA